MGTSITYIPYALSIGARNNLSIKHRGICRVACKPYIRCGVWSRRKLAQSIPVSRGAEIFIGLSSCPLCLPFLVIYRSRPRLQMRHSVRNCRFGALRAPLLVRRVDGPSIGKSRELPEMSAKKIDNTVETEGVPCAAGAGWTRDVAAHLIPRRTRPVE